MINLSLLSMFSVGFAQHLISYVASNPTFECRLEDDYDQFQQCPEIDACLLLAQNSTDARMRFEYYNWAQQAGLGCGREQTRSLAQTYYLSATVTSLFFLVFGSDIFGRKVAFAAIFIVSIAGIVAALLIDNFSVRVTCLGMAMSCIPSYSSMYTIYFSEIMRSFV